jgi:peptidoglycan/LPS O-acetylase OafA/YrhL
MLRTRVTEIDGWRAISVLLVIFSHLLLRSSIAVDLERFIFIDAWGHLGVQIFFVISGFVICRGLLAEDEQRGRTSMAAFYVRRLFRIVPPLLMYLATILTLAYLALVEFDHSQLLRILTFTCNFSVSCGGYVTNHLWSLSVEEQFYLIFPLAFLFFKAFRKIAFGAWGILFPIIVLALMALRFKPASYMADFLYINIGVVCAFYEAEIARICRKLPKFTPALCFGILLLASALVGPDRISTLTRCLVLPPLIALMLMSSHYRPSYISDFLNIRILTSVGQVSYGLYLWQQLATYPFPNAGVGFYAVSLTACVALVYLSFYGIEKPLMALGARISDRLKRT